MISICIPTYEMQGKGTEMLARGFDILTQQTYKDFEVVISDNSEDDAIKDLCQNSLYQTLNIKYFKNPIKGMANNTNEAIKKANGELIKILYMDDFLASKNSLQEIVDNFKGQWLVSGCEHYDGSKRYSPHYPTYTKKIYQGENTIGSPSVLTIKNEKNLLTFDKNMTWLLDCDYYKRLYDKYGEPVLLNKVNVIIGTGKHQMTNILSDTAKKKERYYMAKKYKKRLLYMLGLW